MHTGRTHDSGTLRYFRRFIAICELGEVGCAAVHTRLAEIYVAAGWGEAFYILISLLYTYLWVKLNSKRAFEMLHVIS